MSDAEGRVRAIAAERPDPSRWLIAVGVMLVAFFAAYGYASAAQPAPEGVVYYGAAPAGDETGGCSCCDTGAGATVEGRTTLDGGVQRIDVDATSGYSPNTIVAQAGIPIEIVFSEAYGCMAEVYFPDFGIVEDLTQGGALITLPALEAGQYGFSCGMEMVFGTLTVE
jgi:hypothetical protein